MLALSIALFLQVSFTLIFDYTTAVSLWSGGCTVPESVLRDVFFAYRFVQQSVSLSYTGTTSAAAMCRLKNYTRYCDTADTLQPLSLDFAVLSGPASPKDYIDSPDLQLYPALAFAVVPIYNLGPVIDLVLSGQTLAQIFSGQIVTWDDDRIQKDNPGFAAWGLPAGQPIRVVVRAEACGSVMVLKQALAGFDPVFARTMDLTSNPVWPNLNATVAHGIMGMTSHVMVTPYTIGYSTAGDAQSCSVPIAKLLYRGNAVDASSTRLEYSIMELGALFGNNGDSPAHLTAALHGAAGDNTWPIAGYVYVAMRKSLRLGVACQRVVEAVAFWQWFWTSEVVTMLIHQHTMGALPEAVRNTVLSRIASDVMCNGLHVVEQPQRQPVTGYGPPSVTAVLQRLFDIYLLVDSEVNATYAALGATEAAAAVPGLAPTAFWVGSRGGAAADQLALPLMAVGVAAISCYRLTLDLPALAGILDGNITTWLDPALLALNPAGIQDAAGVAISDPRQRIVLLQGPEGPLTILDPILQAAVPGYTGAAVRRAPLYATDFVLQAALLGIPFSFGIATLSGNFGAALQTASLQRPDGTVVAPTWEAIQACATDAVSRSQPPDLLLYTSALPACYPLADALFLTVTAEQCTAGTGAGRRHLVAFVEWLFNGSETAAALRQQQVAPLAEATPALRAASAAALDFISCTPKPLAMRGDSPWLVLVVILVCATGGVALVLVGVVHWRSTRQMRRLRQQFSNDNVAQECAAAIARFDLDAVAWLQDQKSPNRIQRSFIQIVRLLKEVKPFVPDQLLQSLMNGCLEEGEGVTPSTEESPGRSGQHNDARSPQHRQLVQARWERVRTSSSEMGSDADSTAPRRKGSPLPPRRSLPLDIPQAAQPEPVPHRPGDCQWARRRCAFLYARVEGRVAFDDPATLSDLTRAITAFVAVTKEYGATIDRVGVETVVVHWGLSSHAAEAALNAVQAAMEMEEAAVDLLAALRTPLRLCVGIGYGWCHVATLSASGHRFFISSGPEIKLATNIAHSDVAKRCKCTVLVSSNIQQEVQYSVRCAPRAWLGPELLWEPVAVQPRPGGAEWMYELQRMAESPKAATAATALLAVFHLARMSPPLASMEAAVEELKAQHGDALTLQDVASLDLLLASLPVP